MRAMACVPVCGISSRTIFAVHMIGTARTAPTPPHTENQKMSDTRMTTSLMSRPFRYHTGPRMSPTRNDPNPGMKNPHQRWVVVRSGRSTSRGRGMAEATKLPRLGMKKSQKDTTAMDVESDPGIPHAQMSSPTRVARTALSATMIPTKRFTEAWMRRTIFERSRAGVRGGATRKST